MPEKKDQLEIRKPEYLQTFKPFSEDISFNHIAQVIQEHVRDGVRGAICLDSMAGTGLVGRKMQQVFPGLRVVYQDISKKMLDYGAYGKEDVRILCDSKSLMFPDQSFDIVVCRAGLNNLPKKDYPKVLKEFIRVLKDGGICILQDHFAKNNESKTIINNVETEVANIEGRADETYVPALDELTSLIEEVGGSVDDEKSFELKFSMKNRFSQKGINKPDLAKIFEILQKQSAIKYEETPNDISPVYPGITLIFRKKA